MPLTETYMSNILRRRGELVKLQQDKSKESAKIPTITQKIILAKKAISTSKSESTRKSRLHEIERCEKEISTVNKNIANLEKKIGQKEKELFSEEKKLRDEEGREEAKRRIAEVKNVELASKQMQNISEKLDAYEQVQSIMQKDISYLISLPEKINVLFLASNPIDTDMLQIDVEAREILEKIRASKHRDAVKLETRWAVRPLDILQAINELNPAIVHFSGHGAETGELVLQGSDGSARFITKEAIVQSMMTCSDSIRLVFFNACFSNEQAKAIVEYVDTAIGMNDSIGDRAAQVFAAQFYSAIGFGLSVSAAFNQAKAALMLEGIPEENTPELFVKDGLEAKEVVIVRPANMDY